LKPAIEGHQNFSGRSSAYVKYTSKPAVTIKPTM